MPFADPILLFLGFLGLVVLLEIGRTMLASTPAIGSGPPAAPVALEAVAEAVLPASNRRRLGVIGLLVVVAIVGLFVIPLLVPRLLVPPDRLVPWQVGFGAGGLGTSAASAQTTTSVTIEVQRPTCAPGDTSWLAAPIVTYTPWSVVITMHTSDAFGDVSRCDVRDAEGRVVVGWYLTGTFTTVHLGEPLGGRTLLDGSTIPPSVRRSP